MAKQGKRLSAIYKTLDTSKRYTSQEAIEILQASSSVKFVESVDVSVKLGIDARKSDQTVRGATLLPNGTGKTVRVAVFAEGEQAEQALAAEADFVGMADLADQFKAGQIQVDVVIAVPSAMKLVGQLGQILGPKGLMPNPKVGTVTAQVAEAVKNAKTGQVRYRNDKAGLIHTTIGKINFSHTQLAQNLQALLVDLRKLKPSTAKGAYLQAITISSTMGPGLRLSLTQFDRLK